MHNFNHPSHWGIFQHTTGNLDEYRIDDENSINTFSLGSHRYTFKFSIYLMTQSPQRRTSVQIYPTQLLRRATGLGEVSLIWHATTWPSTDNSSTIPFCVLYEAKSFHFIHKARLVNQDPWFINKSNPIINPQRPAHILELNYPSSEHFQRLKLKDLPSDCSGRKFLAWNAIRADIILSQAGLRSLYELSVVSSEQSLVASLSFDMGNYPQWFRIPCQV